MKLTVCGSGSSGNGYVLHNENEALIIECGVNFIEIKKALNFNISKIKACLISHEHGDHAGCVRDYLQMGIPLVTSCGTLKAIEAKHGQFTRGRIGVLPEKIVRYGGFSIIPFNTIHDAAEPFGFLIHHEETGNVLFATDTSELNYIFPGLNNILIEANYSDEIVFDNIYDGKVNYRQQERVEISHLSIKKTLSFLRRQTLKEVNNIVLIHLSSRNSDAADFKKQVEAETGKNTFTAEKGLTIDFNKTAL